PNLGRTSRRRPPQGVWRRSLRNGRPRSVAGPAAFQGRRRYLYRLAPPSSLSVRPSPRRRQRCYPPVGPVARPDIQIAHHPAFRPLGGSGCRLGPRPLASPEHAGCTSHFILFHPRSCCTNRYVSPCTG
ncbi:hypothetical protein HK405_014069, partial [Cladochytrium tenue]